MKKLLNKIWNGFLNLNTENLNKEDWKWFEFKWNEKLFLIFILIPLFILFFLGWMF